MFRQRHRHLPDHGRCVHPELSVLPCPPRPARPARSHGANPSCRGRFLHLRHAVITSVTRDDLPDGGALFFAETIREVRRLNPGITVEVLIPDFQGGPQALETVLLARPDILNHNLETVKRLYPQIRPQAIYDRSLELLRRARAIDPRMTTKSGLMVGFGESEAELLATFADLREQDCNMLTVGQYLPPSEHHLPVEKFYAPHEFAVLQARAESMGFSVVQSGPLVRSSYHAEQSLPPQNPEQ